MRREDRQITNNEAIEILNKGEYGVLSMCTTDNQGYGVPLNYTFTDNALYFHCATQGSKLEYLKINNKVSFCVVGKTQVIPAKFGTLYESALVSGSILDVEGAEKQDALMLFIEKYSPEYITEGKAYIESFYSRVHIIKLSIESISGKARKQ